MARELISGDAAIKAVKPGDPRKRLNDGRGLYLLLFVKGGSHGWRLDYSIGGRRKTLSLGTYPDTGLALARAKADEARKLVSAGTDPSEVRKGGKAEAERVREAERRADAGLAPVDSFEDVAREWHDTRKGEWSASYAGKILDRLVADVFPYVGARPVGAITPPELLKVLRRIESRGVIETAHRARENCSQVFRFAVATGRAERDPAQDLKDVLRKPDVKHFAAITDPKRMGELLRACDAYAGTPVVRAALRLAPMLLLRPGELRHAQWSEIDLDAATWTVPAHRMKREKAGKMAGPPHVVPLPTQAVEAFRDLQPLTGVSPYVFRGERHHDRPMSENTVNAALRAMGFPADEVTGHGFRASARTMLAERLNVDESVIEAQLAHSVKDSLGRAYNRTQFLEQRRTMMQQWADYLDRLRKGAEVVPLHNRAA
jgi:integrase